MELLRILFMLGSKFGILSRSIGICLPVSSKIWKEGTCNVDSWYQPNSEVCNGKIIKCLAGRISSGCSDYGGASRYVRTVLVEAILDTSHDFSSTYSFDFVSISANRLFSACIIETEQAKLAKVRRTLCRLALPYNAITFLPLPFDSCRKSGNR